MTPKREYIVEETKEIYQACVSIVKYEAILAMPQRIQPDVTSSQFLSQVTTVVGLFKEILEDEKYEDQKRELEAERYEMQEQQRPTATDIAIQAFGGPLE